MTAGARKSRKSEGFSGGQKNIKEKEEDMIGSSLTLLLASVSPSPFISFNRLSHFHSSPLSTSGKFPSIIFQLRLKLPMFPALLLVLNQILF